MYWLTCHLVILSPHFLGLVQRFYSVLNLGRRCEKKGELTARHETAQQAFALQCTACSACSPLYYLCHGYNPLRHPGTGRLTRNHHHAPLQGSPPGTLDDWLGFLARPLLILQPAASKTNILQGPPSPGGASLPPYSSAPVKLTTGSALQVFGG